MKRQQKPNTQREKETKKAWSSTCRKYDSCNRAEKKQGRCNQRCCPSYKPRK